MVNIKIDYHKCDGCGECVRACQIRVLGILDSKCTVVEPEMCRLCMLCTANCLKKAITLEI